MFERITRPEVIMIVAPLLFFVAVLEMVRRRLLREDYSLLWLGTFGVLVILSLFRNSLLDGIARLMGIFYPPTALFVVGFGMVLLVLLQFSSVITRLARENKQAAQHIALLGSRLRELERELEAQERS
jgi:hypothetical protein